MKYLKILIVILCLINPKTHVFIAAIISFWLMYLGKKSPSVINPYYLFLATPVSLTFYNEDLSSFFLSAIEGFTLIIIFLGIISFCIGLISYTPLKLSKDNINYSFWPLFILGSFPYILGILVHGIPIFSDDVDFVKSNFFLPIIGQFTVFLFFAQVLAFKKRNKFFMYLSLSSNLFFNIIIVMKSSLGLLLVTTIFCYLKYTKIRLKKYLIPLFSLLFFVTLFFFQYFGELRNKDNIEYSYKTLISFNNSFLDSQGDVLYAPYFYLTTPWSNLDFNINKIKQYEYGLHTLRPILSILQIDEIVSAEKKLIRNYQFNTHTYLTDFYNDFGIIGVIFLSFIFGRFVMIIYYNMLLRNSALDDTLWIYFGFATLMMFFSNHFTSVGYPIIGLIILYFYRTFLKFSKN